MVLMAVPVPMAEKAVSETVDPVQTTAARLFAQGKTRGQVATTLESYLLTARQRKEKPVRRRLYAMRKLRRWERRKDFRDLVWQYSVERLDRRVPHILDGVARRGEAGRVDAAKLSLELAGRYVPRGEATPANVAIVVNGVPRPRAEVIEATDFTEEPDELSGP